METALGLASGRPTLRRKRPEQGGDSERRCWLPTYGASLLSPVGRVPRGRSLAWPC